MDTLKADNRSRVKLPETKPGTVFALERNGSGQFVLTVVKPIESDVPTVDLVKSPNGGWRFPADRRPGRAAIRAAIRADRDRR
jgi:hypothetical protein